MFNAKNVGSEHETPFQVKAISVAALSKTRMLLAVINEAGKLHLTCLAQDAGGEVLTQLGVREGSPRITRLARRSLKSAYPARSGKLTILTVRLKLREAVLRQ